MGRATSAKISMVSIREGGIVAQTASPRPAGRRGSGLSKAKTKPAVLAPPLPVGRECGGRGGVGVVRGPKRRGGSLEMKRSAVPFYSVRWLRQASEQYTAVPFPASAREAGTKVPQAAQGRRTSGAARGVGGCSAPEETAAFSLCMKFPTAIHR